MKTAELAWAAGFFDGEGSISFKREVAARRERRARLGTPEYLQAHLSISQTEPTTLERFRGAVGGLGHVSGPYMARSRNTTKWSPYWRFSSQKFEHVQAILALLWNYLSGPKRAQARRVLLELRRRP